MGGSGEQKEKGNKKNRENKGNGGTGERGKKGTTRVVLVCQHLFNCQRENKQNNLRKCLPEHD